jgi:hypothetical protein
MIEFLHSPGFLGTSANMFADLTLVVELLILALFSFGFYLAVKGKYDTHKWVQTAGVVLTGILAIWLMTIPYRNLVLQDQGGPREGIFYLVTTLHAVIGFLAFSLGTFVALRGHKLVPKFLQFRNYKLFMRTAYGLYLVTIVLGVWLYYTWYVVIANPPIFE